MAYEDGMFGFLTDSDETDNRQGQSRKSHGKGRQGETKGRKGRQSSRSGSSRGGRR